MIQVAISTISREFLLTNYGSFFQHYALRKVLKGFGCGPVRIRAKGEPDSALGMVGEYIADVLHVFSWILKRVPDVRRHIQRRIVRMKSYWTFRRDFICCIGDFEEEGCFDSASIGILGGDQCLTPEGIGALLVGVREWRTLLTYSASTDWVGNGMRQDWRDCIGSQLAKFSAIGVREKHGVEIIKSILPAKNIEHVADPVMLLPHDEYRRIQSGRAQFRRPTLFCYLVNIRSKNNLQLEKYELLAKSLGCELKMLGIQGAECYIPRRYRVFFSPRQFLRALDDAAYFVTNSYHGSVFAILFQKQFLSVKQNNLPGMDQNERQAELLEQFCLKDRWVENTSDVAAWQQALCRREKWEFQERSMGIYRQRSLDWLEQAIK